MTESPSHPVIAVDGGGTSCRFALVSAGVRHEVKLGSANVFSDFESALTVVNTGLSGLLAQAGLPAQAIAEIPVFAGLAGVIDPDMARKVAMLIDAPVVEVADDRVPAVVGALGDADGALISAGTGSFVGCQSAGRITLIGGHGWLLGDDASGGWLGQALLRRCLRALDGIDARTELIDFTLREFDNNASQVIIFSASARPKDFARLAPPIFDAADTGDPVAVSLVRSGADYLVDALRALGQADTGPVHLHGSVAPRYLRYLPETIAARVTPATGTALDGGLILARRLAQRMAGGPA
ncbi:BadF/BadG/BcrA/BcrD ATPase family protein [Ruegeria marina]|uniref:Glucosamine kinase n=1 Tax=Ruegeria marina TaxID=639004 RepID=A0A1G6IDI4_9RHOB|nr:BadF/BadG/BcrA/BcrD ATPase family protein [Ruegeria marina]SDC04551.1 glucosamine kinase [Ruegeria marina]